MDTTGLVDLKKTEAEKKGDREPSTLDSIGDDYGWGLQLNLGPDEMAKLKLGVVPSGTDMMMMAKVTVVSSSVRESGGKTRASMELQVKALKLDPMQESTDAATALYGANKA